MTRRGVRMSDDAGDDLFEWSPPAPPPPPAPRSPRAAPTDADCRRMERALEPFKLWLLAASIEDLERADPVKLAKKYPPITAPDIAQMIEIRIAGQRRKAR